MMISKIKERVESYLGKKKSFIFNGSRNQIEHFDGVITAVYPSIFIVEMDAGGVRSYSYSDLAISNLEIID